MHEESRLHLVQNSSGAVVHTAEAMPGFRAGDVPGWQARWVDANGIRVHIGKGEPGASFPIHNTGAWIAYVVAGPGTLLLKDTKTGTISRVSYRAGDVFYFGPDTPHGWENGPEPSEMVFVKAR